MKIKQNFVPFCAGMVSAVVLTTCVTGAVAATAGISKWNAINIEVNGEPVLEADKNLTTDYGTSIPSSILYVDETGGGTTYIPIRIFTEMMDLSTAWDGEESVLDIALPTETVESPLSLNQQGITIVGTATEIEPISAPKNATTLLESSCTDEEEFEKIVSLDREKGDYVSVTVTNQNNYAIQLELGVQSSGEEQTITGGNVTITTGVVSTKPVTKVTASNATVTPGSDDGTVKFPTQVPAGATVTRTWKLADAEEFSNGSLVVNLLGKEEGQTVTATVKVTQF
jgi:hypothetical protein